jgi:hypothetical protein
MLRITHFMGRHNARPEDEPGERWLVPNNGVLLGPANLKRSCSADDYLLQALWHSG